MSTAIRLAPAASPPAHHHVVESGLDFEATLQFLRDAITKAGFWLIAEVDPQMLLHRADIAMPPARQLFFFHPRFMAQLLATNPNGLPEAPLKFAVLVHEDGRVRIHHPDPHVAFTAHAGLAPLGTELAQLSCEILSVLPFD